MRAANPMVTALLLGLGGPAMADDSECSQTTRASWISQQQVQSQAVALGYKIRRVSVDDGCSLLKGFDANGARIELKVDPGTGQIVRHDDDR